MVNATPHQTERLLALADAKADLLPTTNIVEAEEDVLMTINAVRHGVTVTAHEASGAIEYLETLGR